MKSQWFTVGDIIRHRSSSITGKVVKVTYKRDCKGKPFAVKSIDALFLNNMHWTIVEYDLPHVLLVREAIGQTANVEWPEGQEATQ